MNVPVTVFFEDEAGGKVPAVDVEKLKNENEGLKKRVGELEEQLEDKKYILKDLKEKIEILTLEKDDAIEMMPIFTKMVFEVKEAWNKYLGEVEEEKPDLVDREFELRRKPKPITIDDKDEINRLTKERFTLAYQKMMQDSIIRRHWNKVNGSDELRFIWKGMGEKYDT